MLDGFSKNPFLLPWVEMAGEHIHQLFSFISTLQNMLVWMSLMVFLPVGSFVFALSDHLWLNNQWLNWSLFPKDTFYLSNLHRLFNCCSHLNCQCDVNGLLCSVAMWDVSLGRPCIQHIASHSRCINTVSDFIALLHSSSPISSICYTEATIYVIPFELKWGTQVVERWSLKERLEHSRIAIQRTLFPLPPWTRGTFLQCEKCSAFRLQYHPKINSFAQEEMTRKW
jgi:hypothetical protein